MYNDDNNDKKFNKKQFVANFFSGAEYLGDYLFLYSPFGLIGRRYAEPALDLIHDVVRRNIIVPVHRAIGVTPNPYIKSEYTLSYAFKNQVKRIIEDYMDENIPDWEMRLDAGECITFYINGDFYSPNYGGSRNEGERSFWERLTTPPGQVEVTLGNFKVTASKSGYRVRDTYDFDTNIRANSNSLYGKIRNLANIYATSQDAPDNEKIMFNIFIKRASGGPLYYPCRLKFSPENGVFAPAPSYLPIKYKKYF